MALNDYLVSEVCVDRSDGTISRREALHRLALLGVSAATAGVLLAACGDDGGDDGASPQATDATSAAAPTSVAPPPSAPVTGDPTAVAEPISFPGPAGDLQGWFAAAEDPKGAVLIIHENRGLTEHFQTLPARFAADGYSALAVDLLSREGGTASFADPAAATAALGAAAQERLTEDMRAGLDELAARVPDEDVAAIGFCFGGAQVWRLLAAGEPRLVAAAPFYGPGPEQADFSGSQAAVLGVYAELDSRVNASMPAMEEALTAAGLTHELRVFPGVDHAFFNDTGQRYDATQAAAAYAAVLAWFDEHVAAP
jgi:carboxymethylenebutenolidase